MVRQSVATGWISLLCQQLRAIRIPGILHTARHLLRLDSIDHERLASVTDNYNYDDNEHSCAQWTNADLLSVRPKLYVRLWLNSGCSDSVKNRWRRRSDRA
jgi:hypothetical protein